MEPVSAGATAPWWAPAAIAGGASFLGSVGSAVFGASQANKQMDFQERMSSTAHQREVEDLRKAGLNPILSAKLGGSSTPPGAQANVPDLGSSAKAGIEAQLAASQINLAKAQAFDVTSSARLKNVQADDVLQTRQDRLFQLRADVARLLDQADLTWQQQQQINKYMSLLDKQIEATDIANQSSALGLERDKKEAKFWKGPGGTAAPYIREFGTSARAVMEGYMDLKRMRRGDLPEFEHTETYRDSYGNHHMDRYRQRGRR